MSICFKDFHFSKSIFFPSNKLNKPEKNKCEISKIRRNTSGEMCYIKFKPKVNFVILLSQI